MFHYPPVNYGVKNIKQFFCLIILFSTLLSCLTFSFLNAADNEVGDKSKTKGLTLSPLRKEAEVAPGNSIKETITISNLTEKKMTVRLSAEKFSVINQQYDYSFSDGSDIVKWIMFGSDQITLEAGESKKVLFTIAVPLDEEPGGKYISIFASSDIESGDNVVNLRQRVGSLLYITVTGNVTRFGKIISLSSPWIIGGESSWGVVLQNSGTTHFLSQYNLTIESLFGRNKIVEMSDDSLILPDSVRAITAKLPSPNIPGIYKAVYTIGLGDTPAKVEIRYIIYLPFWFLLMIMLLGYFIFWIKTNTNTKKGPRKISEFLRQRYKRH